MRRSHVASVAVLLLLSILTVGADKLPEGNSRIVGRVIDAHAKGMPQLLVKLVLPRGMKDSFPTTQPIKGGKNAYIEGTTDQQGYFRFEKLPPGRYAVNAELDGTGRGSVDVTVVANKTMTVQIMLKPRRGETQ